MTSIDDLFKSHNGTKRKFENPIEADPSQAYKSVKLEGSSSDAKRSAQVQDEDDDGDEAGPALPPAFGDEEPDDDDDDEEGRFFGGGLDDNAKDAMDFLDAQDGDDVLREEKYDVAWVRKMARDFEKKVNKNATLRAKYESDPTKFMESEGDLDDAIKDLSILSEHAELYDEFAKSTAASKLVELLAHENTDIAIGAIEMISELTDEDVAAEQEQWDALVAAFLDADLLGLLISNFSRFDETDSTDASGVYHSLSVLENLLSQPSNTDTIGQDKTLVTWLLERIQKPEKPTSQNKQYASELLSILTQSSRPNRALIANANGVETFLTNLAPYRRDDPQKDSDEEEYMENLFNCLTSIVDEPIGKTKFLEAEGVELCLLLVRDGKTSKSRALKVLDHACGYAEPDADTKTNPEPDTDTDTNTPPHIAVCTQLISARGLKPLFTTFMKPHPRSPTQTEHILGIFCSLLRSLPSETDARYRLLAKFLEKDYAKITHLLRLRQAYVARLSAFEADLAARKARLGSAEEREQLDEESVSLRLSEGLYALQCVDATLGWLVGEDGGAREAVVSGLADTGASIADVRATLQARLEGVMRVEGVEREVVQALVRCLV